MKWKVFKNRRKLGKKCRKLIESRWKTTKVGLRFDKHKNVENWSKIWRKSLQLGKNVTKLAETGWKFIKNHEKIIKKCVKIDQKLLKKIMKVG